MSYKNVEIIVYETVDGVSRIQYKDYIIQTYGFDNGKPDLDLCHFIIDPDGHEVGEDFCLLKAIKRIDKLISKLN